MLKSLSDVRDGLLIAGAVFYGFGYVVLSVNSLVYGLGLLPALDVQYFVAGLVPILALSLAYLIRRLVRDFVEGVWAWIEKTVWLRIVLDIAVGAALGYFYTVFFELDWFFTFAFAGLFIVSRFLTPLATPRAEGGTSATPGPGIGRLLARGIGWVLPWGLAFAVSAAFVVYAYPLIPQEFGGVRPRCALLDLLRSEVSSDTLVELGSQSPDATNTRGTGPAVIRSAEVFVYFEGGGSILVKRHKSRDAETFDLSGEAVRASVSCPDQ